MATAVGAANAVDPTIIQQLQIHILPYVITAERLWRRPEYLAFSVYSYLRAFLAAVVGAGISAPILNFLNSLTSAAPESSQARAGVAQVPEGLTWVGISIIILLIGVQTYFAKREVEKRWVLAQSCRKEFRSLNSRAVRAMGSADVVNQLARIRNEVSVVYQRHSSEDSWPYSITEPGIDQLVQARLTVMVQQLETNPNAAREIDQEELWGRWVMVKLLAEFEIENDQPAFVQGPKHKHYRIRLFLEGVPQDAITVRYQLDPTYKNPIRIVSAGAPQFNEFTTAYGDYLIQVSMRKKSDPNYDQPLTSARLAEALQAKYAGTVNASITVAIDEIAGH